MSDNSGKTGATQTKTLTRRTAVQRLGLTGGGLWALGSSGVLQSTTALAAAAPSYVVGGVVGIELDGAITLISAFEGGHAVADVVAEAVFADRPTAKRPGAVRYEDLVLKVTFDVSPTLASWIQASIEKGPSARSGAIVFFDLNRVEVKRLAFVNAIITEVALPICDASLAKAVPQMTIRLTPESTSWSGGSGKILQLPTAKAPISVGVFRLNIKGMDAATPYVTRIEGVGVRRATQSDAAGQSRSKSLVGAANVQPIKLFLLESRAAPFYRWFDSFILRGGAAAGEPELPGLLEWLAPNLTTVVASVQLINLGIVRYAPEPYAPGTNKPEFVQVELYCEQLSVSWPA